MKDKGNLSSFFRMVKAMKDSKMYPIVVILSIIGAILVSFTWAGGSEISVYIVLGNLSLVVLVAVFAFLWAFIRTPERLEQGRPPDTKERIEKK